MPASTLLRAARHSHGISQSALAARSRTSQPDISFIENGKRTPTVDTLERILRQVGHRLIAIPSGSTDAVETAEAIAIALTNEAPSVALRHFLTYSDGLARSRGIDRITLALAEPHLTGSLAWDAAMAAVVDYWLSASSLPTPEWIAAPSRTLAAPESPQLSRYDIEPDTADVPREFLRRNVLIERRTLESV